MPWIVDGSNLGGVLGGAAGARDRPAVFQRVFAWAHGRRRVVLVFDGSADAAIPDRVGTVEVRWAEGQTADQVVLRAVGKKPREWRVVTDDRALARACRDVGATVVPATGWLGATGRRPRSAAVEAKTGGGSVDVEDWLAWFKDGGSQGS